MRFFNKFLALLVMIMFCGSAFAVDNTYTAYNIGQALGKVSHKSFKAMDQELRKKDFIAGFDNTILNQKPDVNKVSDKDSYEVGMIIAAQYKSKLKKMITINEENSKSFVEGFNKAADAKEVELSTQDKQILKHFKIYNEDEDN
ncbi:hypothetical protein LO80_00725 [Candidatus Francisella endociliophora]|uniref:Peptidyl-prolyl cis-trans isomerase FKBP-type N-terminal domain-containing protein n=1 Tax=Candidatus Francisella endociliophora TaxID=653937 RepID=A0A097EM47_9GAMM|nr:hypothetical protein [Francisella sp. FSC1006]AIT08641.1 hypothetical protein LO80_00725 [Francisella sp. FSC1006]